MTDRPLTVSQAAEYCGISPSTIRRYADRGVLPSYRLPAPYPARRFTKADLDKFRDLLHLR